MAVIPGLDPISLILAGIAGGAQGAASGLTNENITPSSFADRDASGGPGDNFFLQDPVGLLQSATRGATNIGQGFADLASRPVSLPSAFAQPLPTFVGGGLPMPVGVSGADPALFDPSLLSIPGVSVGENPFQEDPGGGPRGVVQNDPRTTTQGGQGIGAIPGLSEATGAAQLLMEAAQEPIPDLSGTPATPEVGGPRNRRGPTPGPPPATGSAVPREGSGTGLLTPSDFLSQVAGTAPTASNLDAWWQANQGQLAPGGFGYIPHPDDPALVLPGGQHVDLIQGGGGPNPQWQWRLK